MTRKRTFRTRCSGAAGQFVHEAPVCGEHRNLPLRLRARVIFSDSAAQDACTLNYNTENWRYDETEDFWYYAKTLQPGEDCRNDALFDTVTYSESADATALNHYTLSVYFEAVQEGGTW